MGDVSCPTLSPTLQRNFERSKTNAKGLEEPPEQGTSHDSRATSCMNEGSKTGPETAFMGGYFQKKGT